MNAIAAEADCGPRVTGSDLERLARHAERLEKAGIKSSSWISAPFDQRTRFPIAVRIRRADLGR
jgi:hypothetical protein